ncbi:MAG: hypothetical protein IKQ20_13575 [Bacteroidales bacterium]|nr:hypothetical protein [Bacteroidales bacterium]
MLAPIVLFVYNRPLHTKQTVEALLKNELASDSELYIFADGPKNDTTEDSIIKIKEVRDYIHTIKGFKKIYITESDYNIGLDNSVIQAVTKVIELHEKVIVVEDDIVTHPFFLRFINQALDTYKNQTNIYMISGFSYNITFPNYYKNDVYCVHRCCSWGWGMWADRWEQADWKLSNYKKLVGNKNEIKKFNRGGNDLFNMLQILIEQPVCAWDIRWTFCMYEHNGLCINPTKSLVNNIGFDGSGTHKDHITNDNYIASFPNTDTYNYVFPFPIRNNTIMDKQIRSFLDGSPSFIQRIKYSIKKRLIKLNHI